MMSATELAATIAAAAMIGLAAAAASAGEPGPGDLRTVLERLRADLVADPPPAGQVERLLKDLADDGHWPDVDYRSRRSASWPGMAHVARLVTLARAWRATDAGARRDRLRAAILSGLDYWLAKDPRSPNWWHNRIGVPRLMGRLLVLMGEDLSEARRGGAMRIMARSRIGMTAQNRVWLAHNALVAACVAGDAEKAARAAAVIAGQVRVTTREGIQPDFSFHQHGPQLYCGGYGASFAMDQARWARTLRGTPLAYGPEKLGLLADYVMRGQQWMVRDGVMDYGAHGRGISRKGVGAGALAGAAEDLAAVAPKRAAELRAFAARIRGRAAPGTPPAPRGNRHFWRSDFMVHRREGYYASVKMHSRRTVGSESGNREGLLNHYVADGCNYVLRHGREYDGIFPVWDWRKVPGVTCRQSAKGLPPLGWGGYRGKTRFVGGVSDGRFALAAMDYDRAGVTARKAWLFLDDGWLCLGAAIASRGPGPVATTVNQCLLRGPVTAASGGRRRVLKPGRHELTGPAWVHHDGVGYVFPAAGEAVRLTNREQTGNWHRINHRYGREEVRRDVFCLWLDHGKDPSGAGYAYVVLPAAGGEPPAARAPEPGVETVANTSACQAARHGGLGLTGAAFYQPGRVESTGGVTIAVDRPCLLLARHVEEGLAVTVADPAQRLKSLTVTLGAKLAGEGAAPADDGRATAVRFELPRAGRAGSSVTRLLRPKE